MLKDLVILKSDVLHVPLVDEEALLDFKLPRTLKANLKHLLNAEGYQFNEYTSYAITDKASENKPANFAVIPNQYLVYAAKMYEFSVELYRYFIIFEKVRAHAKQLVGNALEIENNIKNHDELYSLFDSDNDLKLFTKFIDKSDSSSRFGSKRLINDHGVPRGSRDCFGSVILKEINLPDSSSSIFGRLVYDLCQHGELYRELKKAYDNKIVKGLDSTNLIFSHKIIRTFIYGVIDVLKERLANLERGRTKLFLPFMHPVTTKLPNISP